MTSAGRSSGIGGRLLTTLALAVTLLGTAVGVGAFGGVATQDAGGGAFAADATHLAPAGTAFSIWSVIYLGLAAYTVQQWWDGEDRRRLRALAIASMLLNAAWLLVVQAGWVMLSVLVIAALLAVLVLLQGRLAAQPPSGILERIVVDGTFGLYLGWVCVATGANIAAALRSVGLVSPAQVGASTATALVLLVLATAAGAMLCVRTSRRAGRGPIALPAALVWGLAWIAVGRLTDAPHSALVGGAAIAAAVLIAVTAVQLIRTPRP